MTNDHHQDPRAAQTPIPSELQDEGQQRQAYHTVRDGALAMKVWQNQSRDGRPYFKVTLDKLYTDPSTGETKRTQSFDQADLLRLQNMVPETYRVMSEARKLTKDHAPQQDLRRSRDEAMGRASQPSNGITKQTEFRRRGPDQF